MKFCFQPDLNSTCWHQPLKAHSMDMKSHNKKVYKTLCLLYLSTFNAAGSTWHCSRILQIASPIYGRGVQVPHWRLSQKSDIVETVKKNVSPFAYIPFNFKLHNLLNYFSISTLSVSLFYFVFCFVCFVLFLFLFFHYPRYISNIQCMHKSVYVRGIICKVMNLNKITVDLNDMWMNIRLTHLSAMSPYVTLVWWDLNSLISWLVCKIWNVPKCGLDVLLKYHP